MERYIYDKANKLASHSFATDDELNESLGKDNWVALSTPPADMQYPKWDGKQWVNNDTRNYKEKRIEAYPSIGDQLDMMYHDFDGWKKSIKKIKDEYPKS